MFEVPDTEAANACDSEEVSAREPGVIVTLTGGVKVTLAAADFFGLATLVATTMTTCLLEIIAGAV